MRRVRSSLLGLIGSAVLLSSSFAYADTISVASRADAVTVFTSAVTIHRVARVRVGEGDHTVVFAPLPVSLDEDSIRIGGFGPGATADAVTVRNGLRGELMQGRLIELQSQLTGLQREFSVLTQRANALAVAERGRANVGNQLAEVRARLADLTTRINEQAAALQQARTQAAEPVRFVSVDVSTARAGDLDLSIEYMVPNAANWRPSYAAHLDETRHRVGLDVFASLQQNTGEDWSDVRVSVSTVTPASGLTVPQLGEADVALDAAEEVAQLEDVDMSLRVRRRSMMAPSAAGAGRAMSAMAEPAMPTPIEPPNTPMTMRAAETHAQSLSARIEIPNRVTIRSGATPRRVLAAHFEVDAALEYQAAPSQSTAVYLVSRFANRAQFPLLAGRVGLFVGDQYVGAANLTDTPIDEPVLLPFGADAGLAIERTLAARRVDRSGARDLTSLRYQFRLANHRDRAARVVIFDRLPVSQTHGLVVRAAANARAPEAHHDGDAPGIVRWTMEVDPGATTRWDFGYTLDAPRGRTVSGEMP